ncbi:MAG: hypothetical protein HYZ50_00505 [Deltaproteobacteria bacterium]|nr:hypothetical protein [Deltaproteobacteria bacterium]
MTTTKVCISFAGSSGLSGFPDFPAEKARELQAAFPSTNISLAKSPTQTVPTQTNHFFAALCGFIKLERLKMRTQLNHFALKSKLYLNALPTVFSTLRTLTTGQVTA